MIPLLNDIMRASESRYLTRDEMQQINRYTGSLPMRFKAAGEIEVKEEAIIQSAIEQVKRRYSTFERYHPQAWEKGARDLQLCLRYAVQAMICDDPNFQADRLLYWLGTIFHAFGFSPQFNRDTFAFLRDAVKQQATPETFGMLEPFLEKNIEVLGNMPEPAQVLV